MGHAVRNGRDVPMFGLASNKMNAESNKKSTSLAEQLSSFDDQLEGQVDDVKMLADIQDGIGRLLASSDSSEAEVRRVLHDRYEKGELRKETFQLVKSMLDDLESEGTPTSAIIDTKATPDTARIEPELTHVTEPSQEVIAGDDQFGRTTVIPVSESVQANTAEDLVQVGSVLRDRFMLQERVSGGSMGVVYKALDRRLAEANAKDPWVAIKVLAPQLAANGKALRALQQEAAKGRCLTHPNIVRFLDLDRDEDLYFIVMEWLEGQTLADILDAPDTGRINQERAFSVIRDLGKALEYSHRCGIVHADVKPGNIMIMPNGEAKLFDFGVARVRQTQIESTSNFDPGVLGRITPAYSSMQVLTGDNPVPSDDVFSLACLLYRLIAGYRVFGPRNAAQAAEEGMKPQRLAGINDGHWRTLKKALSFSRVTRFETMTDFMEALAEESDDTASVQVIESLDIDEAEGSGRWIFALFAFIALAGFAAYQFGYLDEVIARFEKDSPSTSITARDEVFSEPAPEQVEVDDVGDAVIDEDPVDSSSEVVAAAVVPEEVAGLVDLPYVAIEVDPLVDFSLLPLASVEIVLPADGTSARPVTITLQEDGSPVIVDMVRDDVSLPLTLRLEEVGFSGNRSPWVSGQYSLSDGGVFEFPVGQERARLTLTMASDPLREADQQSTLRVREVDGSTLEFAKITVVLEDDDQRAFEAQLPANTVAFSMSQASVRERDPAVQIDIQRFNPDNTTLVVAYTLRDITATEGEDYFAPGSQVITFGPGQRSARLLIPLVRDSAVEGDEAFIVELSTDDAMVDVDVYDRIAVMIRDDE